MCIDSAVVQVHENVPRSKAFIGVRRWKWSTGSQVDEPRLYPASVHHTTAWQKPGVQRSRKPGRHVGSDLGFHALSRYPRQNDFKLVYTEQSSPDYVIGTVKLWGRVVRHRTGYRAQFAEVHTLRAPGLFYHDGVEEWHKSYTRLAKRYGVRIVKVKATTKRRETDG